MAGPAEHAETHQRALRINLDRSIYGSFAEIGAGQEVARWFFQVGGAAGTIGRTISAYDMAMSDALYGKSPRYVSRDRLLAMLDREHALLVQEVGAARGPETRLFAFADTVAARNYAGTNECHGWLGVRFQAEPGAPASDAVLHVNLLEPSNLLQQLSVGVLGVNLIHAAYHDRGSPARFLDSLFDGLSRERVEVDVADLRGPAFRDFDPRLVGLRLARQGLASAVVFDAAGGLAPPTEMLRRRPIVLERGRYRTDKALHGPLLAAAGRHLQAELTESARPPLCVFEMHAGPTEVAGAPADAEVLQRIARLTGRGYPVAVTGYPLAWELTEYLRRYTQEPIRFALGAAELVEVLLAQAGEAAVGGGLESLGKLLARNVRLYVYPMTAEAFRDRLQRAGVDPGAVAFDPARPVAADAIRFAPPFGHFYDYLIGAGWVVPLPPLPA